MTEKCQFVEEASDSWLPEWGRLAEPLFSSSATKYLGKPVVWCVLQSAQQAALEQASFASPSGQEALLFIKQSLGTVLQNFVK